jgi:hypothetical protein
VGAVDRGDSTGWRGGLGRLSGAILKWRDAVKISNLEFNRGATRRRFVGIGLAATLLTGGIAAGLTDGAPPASAQSEDRVRALALQWFVQLQAGHLDRTQLTAAYSAQLTDEIVRVTSRHLNQYGASPIVAHIMLSRTIGEQTFYLVKLHFPRGDAASLLLGFNAEGKITGISIMSMAGD